MKNFHQRFNYPFQRNSVDLNDSIIWLELILVSKKREGGEEGGRRREREKKREGGEKGGRRRGREEKREGGEEGGRRRGREEKRFLVKYKKYKYTYYIYIKYLTSYFGLRTRELKERKMKEILETIYQYRDNIRYLKIYHDHYKI